MSLKNIAITLFGPTASGKTGLGIALARHFDGEIVNADSRQVYQQMPILTAMPSEEEFAAAPHRLFSFLPPENPYDAAQYAKDAQAEIKAVWKHKKPAIVVGGTGFYLDVLLNGMSQMPPVKDCVLEAVKEQLDQQGMAPLLAELKEKDPDYYAQAGVAELANPQRVVRALAMCKSHRKPFSYYRSLPKKGGLKADAVINVGLLPPREILYQRIEKRFDLMMEQGVVEEAQALFQAGISLDGSGVDSIGLREMMAYCAGHMSLDEAKAQMVKQTKNYAKRQSTWMRTQYAPDLLVESAEQLPDVIEHINRVIKK